MSLSKKQQNELVVWEYFMPNWCRWLPRKEEDVKKFFEWSERGLHKDENFRYGHVNSWFQGLVWGKTWAYRSVYEVWETSFLDGSFCGYMELVEGMPEEVVEFIKRTMFKGYDAERIEMCYNSVNV